MASSSFAIESNDAQQVPSEQPSQILTAENRITEADVSSAVQQSSDADQNNQPLLNQRQPSLGMEELSIGNRDTQRSWRSYNQDLYLSKWFQYYQITTILAVLAFFGATWAEFGLGGDPFGSGGLSEWGIIGPFYVAHTILFWFPVGAWRSRIFKVT